MSEKILILSPQRQSVQFFEQELYRICKYSGYGIIPRKSGINKYRCTLQGFQEKIKILNDFDLSVFFILYISILSYCRTSSTEPQLLFLFLRIACKYDRPLQEMTNYIRELFYGF